MSSVHQERGIREDPEAVERYKAIKGLGSFFEGAFQQAEVTRSKAGVGKVFLQKAARVTNPPVWASYWDHVLLAPEIGRMVAKAARDHEVKINPDQLEFLLWTHDLARMVLPGSYLKNDLLTTRLLLEAGVPKRILSETDSLANLMDSAYRMGLDPDQYRWRKPLTNAQQGLADHYFEAKTPTQRIYNLADNLGKRGPQGLFSLASFIGYLKSQEGRYGTTSQWPSVKWAIQRREQGAFLQGMTVEKTVDWLSQNGVNFDQIREQLLDYGAKFILVLRHGELNNPNSIVYNRDSVMRPDDIIHLANEGTDQMKAVGEILKQRGFRVSRVLVSPETRARESAEAMGLGNIKPEVARYLDDLFAPGPYLEGMKMKDLEAIGGNVYGSRWNQYHHESPEQVIERMNRAFWDLARNLKVSETGVLISHGDPIAWLMNTIVEGQTPTPENLRKLIYPNEGEGMVFVLDSNDELFTTYSLNPTPKTMVY